MAGGSQAMNAIPISAAMYAGQQYGFGDPFTGSNDEPITNSQQLEIDRMKAKLRESRR